MKNIQLISASAGSGKTYRLMNEIADRVVGKQGTTPIAPEEIMATTFTNKAAAELKERIRMRLLEEGRTADAQRIYDGLIGTVNSICARLLKEYAFEAGLSPAVDVLPEEDAARIFNMATSSAIESASKKLEPIARRLGLMGYGSRYSKQADWRDFVHDIVDLARSNDMDAESLKASAKASRELLEKLLGKAHGKAMGAGEDKRLKDAVFKAIEAIQNDEKINKPARETIQSIHLKLVKGWELSWADWKAIESINIGVHGSELIKSLWAPWDDESDSAGHHLKHPSFRSDMNQMISGVFECAAKALEEYASFKREQGLMDFVDQEVLVLRMIRENASFRASIEERVKLLMVDEFQDTSPIQLALFLKLSELAQEVVWVGDQKQAIYGFRGTDPVLMDSVASEIEAQNQSVSDDNVLKESWRSKRALVDFSNAIFVPVFHHMGEAKVRLDIPAQRENEVDGGWLEDWLLEGSNQDKRTAALVSGIQALIEDRGISAGDIAILSRSNIECEKIAQALNGVGIKASITQGELLATQECTLALAALRYMEDQRDSVAMAEIVCYSEHHQSHDGWMQQLLQHPDQARLKWADDPLMQGLESARKSSVYLTPLESLEMAMAVIDVERMIYAWGNADHRISNLDQLRAACDAYQDRCKSRRGAATITGFLTWLYSEAELKQAEGTGSDTVNVLTYHKSKGLEWPVVVLASLNNPSRNNLFGVAVRSADNFSVDEPLAGRSIHFWPWPYGTKKSAPDLMACIEGSDIASETADQAMRESQRVFYVGLTRARDGLVLVREMDRSKNISHKWLDEMIDKDGNSIISVDDDCIAINSPDQKAQTFTVKSRCLCEPEDGGEPTVELEERRYFPQVVSEKFIYPAASQPPSSVGWDGLNKADVQTSLFASLGNRLALTGKPAMDDLGNAIHGFLGADNCDEDSVRLAMAEQMLSRWKVEGAIEPAYMLLASNRLNHFITEQYPEVKILREWPMTMALENNQRLQGWLDMLLKLPDGYVVIDHKSYPGDNVEEHVKQYVPQLAVYKKAVEQATGMPVLKTLIHLPIQGKMVQVSW